MNKQNVPAQERPAPVPTDFLPENPKFLREVAEKLEADGEVFVQTDDTVGTEAVRPTVH